MDGLGGIGKALVMLGLGIAVVGVLFLLLSRLGISRLPGDIVVQKKNFVFYAPLGLMILVSLVLTILLNLFAKR